MRTSEEIALYIGRKYSTGLYIRPVILKLSKLEKIGTKPTLPVDDKGNPSKDEVDLAIFKENVKSYSLLQRQYAADLKKTYNLILGQCSEDMQAKIEAHNDYSFIDQSGSHESDLIELLKIIRSIMCNFQSQRLPEISFITAMQRLFSLYQFENESVQNFKLRWNTTPNQILSPPPQEKVIKYLNFHVMNMDFTHIKKCEEKRKRKRIRHDHD